MDAILLTQRMLDDAAYLAEGGPLPGSPATTGHRPPSPVSAQRPSAGSRHQEIAHAAAYRDWLIETAKGNNRLLREALDLWSGWIQSSLAAMPGASPASEAPVRFLLEQAQAALAPENYFWANAAAVRRYLDTQGESLTTGYGHWLKDTQAMEGLVPTVDQCAFTVGRDLAATAGAVVARNPLCELIQYAPTTSRVHETPILFVPPWINKYYILDLSPSNSLIAWLRDQGFTVFSLSWKNPDPAMRDVEFADYVLTGALEAIDKVRDITGAQAVHAVGFCIGGTALATLMAWLSPNDPAKSNGSTRSPVAHWTLLATLVDFSDPGPLRLFTDPEALPLIEALTGPTGLLDGTLMELVFRSLRSDSLIWRPAIRRYLYGDPPPKSDVLYWNSDTTRLTQRMLRFYLEELYIGNRLVCEDGLSMNGRRLHLTGITQPLYLVGCIQDHIVPWTQTLRIRSRLKGPIRFALSSEGHVAGIVNPPAVKSFRRYWAADIESQLDPQGWLEQQEARSGSWWPDWAHWLAEHCGPRVAPPRLGSESYPPLCPAPGLYVME